MKLNMIFTIQKFEIWPLDVLLAAVKLRRSRGYSFVLFFCNSKRKIIVRS